MTASGRADTRVSVPQLPPTGDPRVLSAPWLGFSSFNAGDHPWPGLGGRRSGGDAGLYAGDPSSSQEPVAVDKPQAP